MNKQRGFTLIELMVALAIVAILTAVAAPIYTNYISRGALTESRTELFAQQMRLEQFFADNRNYNGLCTGAFAIETKYYNVACVTPDPDTPSGPSYRLVATGKAGTAAAGFTFSINQANLKKTLDAPGNDGATDQWKTNDSCWIVREGEGSGAC